MSQENVDLVREAFEAWYPNDSEAFDRHLAPEFEYEITYGPESGVFQGLQATVDALDRWEEPFSDYHWRPDTYLDGGDDYVVVPFTEGGHGKTSGIRIQQRRAFLCHVRDHKILRLVEYPSTAEAFGAVALSDSTLSQDNVEIVRRVYKLAEAQGVEGLLELATDDVVWISDPRFPGGGTRSGKADVERWLRELWIYDEISIDVEEIIDLNDRALAITRFHGVSAGAPPVDWPWCHLFTFREGLVSQAQSFLDRAQALQAAGLSE
jgi:ketosteroid isomerase-like protein